MILNNVKYIELMFLNVELQDITSMDFCKMFLLFQM